MTRRYAALAAFVLLLQVFLQGQFLPWSGLLTPARINAIDAPFHLYQMQVARDLCRQGRVVGYDPRFGGGHLGGVPLNASAKLQSLALCLAPDGTSAAVVYKQISFWGGVLAPLLLVAAAAWAGLPFGASALAAMFGVLLWWTGALRWYHTAGMVSWVLASYAALPFVAAFVRWSDRVTAWRCVALGSAAALGFLIHPLFCVVAILLGVPWVLVDIVQRGELFRRLFMAGAVAAIMIASAWVWLLPSLTSPGFATEASPYQRLVDPLLFLREMMGHAPTAAGGSRLYGALLLGAGVAVVLQKGVLRKTTLALCAAAALMMVWASFGGLLEPVAKLQPNRFSATAWLVLALPAAAGMHELWRRAMHSRGVARGSALAGLAVGLALPAYFIRDAWREATAAQGAPRYGVQPPEARGPGPVENALVAFLQRHSDNSARVMFENSLARVHDGGHVAGMVALRTGRELIGGPYPFTVFANAWDGRAFGRPLSTLDDAGWVTRLDAYNVRWMVCHSAECKQAMARLPDTLLVGDLGRVAIFERGHAPGYFIHGQGQVAGRCTDRVEVVGASGPSLVLRYQWVPGLVAIPSGRVSPARVIEGLPPFVAVDGAPSSFALTMNPGADVTCSARQALGDTPVP